MAVFLPTYFSPISQFSVLWNLNNIIFEVEDNYQKQSYRNRCCIYGANGLQTLTVPISFTSNLNRKKTKDAKIDYSENWQKQHLKSLESAYNSSPYYHLLEIELKEIYQKKHSFLLDLTIDSFLFVKDILSLETNFTKTKEYQLEIKEDYRFLADKNSKLNFNEHQYQQVFMDKHGFIKNLSILDLLFMEGPNSISFLEKKLLHL